MIYTYKILIQTINKHYHWELKTQSEDAILLQVYDKHCTPDYILDRIIRKKKTLLVQDSQENRTAVQVAHIISLEVIEISEHTKKEGEINGDIEN